MFGQFRSCTCSCTCTYIGYGVEMIGMSVNVDYVRVVRRWNDMAVKCSAICFNIDTGDFSTLLEYMIDLEFGTRIVFRLCILCNL